MSKIKILSLLFLATLGLNACKQKTNQKINAKQAKHVAFLEKSPYSKTKYLSKSERKSMGLPPNPYQEAQWELTMDPETGRPTPEVLANLVKDLEQNASTYRVPGDALDNSWEERGPNNVAGRVKALLFDPNDTSGNTVFAGGITGGLWKNTNISSTASAWSLVDFPENVQVTSITVDSQNNQTFYIGTGESYTGDGVGNGVWKSTNGGNSWTHVFGGPTGNVTYETNVTLTVNSPAAIAGDYLSYKAGFQPDFTTFSGNLVLADDGTANPTEACSSLTNGFAMSGNVAFIKRGNCNFVDKVRNAQAAGATAAIVYNNVETGLVTMSSDTASDITIPSIFISKADGETILAQLNAGTTVNITANFSAAAVVNLMLVHGETHINDVVVRNNGGTSEIYVAVGNAFYSSSSPSAVMGTTYEGIYKSTDGGVNWSQITLPQTTGGNSYTPMDLEIGADNAIWMSTTNNTYHGEGGGAIFKSIDGNTFILKTTISGGLRTEIACSKSNANKIYALIRKSDTNIPVSIYKTTDGFTTETLLTLPIADGGLPANDFTNGQAFYNLAIAVDPNDDETVYVGGIDWHKSSNGGVNWTQISHYYGAGGPRLHPDQHGIAFFNSNKIVFGNDGGVGYTSDGGSSITHVNKNLNVTQFYHMGVAPTTAFTTEHFVAGAQDNGTQLFESATLGINASTQAFGGDGAFSFFDQDGTDKYYIGNYVYNASIQLYDYNTGTTRTINNEGFDNGDFINQEALDSNQNSLFTNYSTHATSTTSANYRLAVFSNLLSGSVSKTVLDNALLTSNPTTLKVSPYTTTSSTLYIGCRDSKLIKLTNPTSFLASWTDISGPDFLGSISDVELGTSEQELFVTMYNYNTTNVWYSADGGNTWAAKDGNLPNIPVRCILQNPLNTEQVILGTQLGIWWTNNFSDANPTWYQGNNGMRSVIVNDLQLRNDNKVYAATYGRGIFSGQFTAATASVNEVANSTNAISIYPTVSNGNFTLKTVSNNTLGNVQMDIFDINGKRVYSKAINLANEVNTTINVSTGTYIIKLKGETIQESHKIIIK